MINVSNEGIFVEFRRKNNTTLVYFQIAGKYCNSFKTNPLYIIFNDFSI